MSNSFCQISCPLGLSNLGLWTCFHTHMNSFPLSQSSHAWPRFINIHAASSSKLASWPTSLLLFNSRKCEEGRATEVSTWTVGRNFTVPVLGFWTRDYLRHSCEFSSEFPRSADTARPTMPTTCLPLIYKEMVFPNKFSSPFMYCLSRSSHASSLEFVCT